MPQRFHFPVDRDSEEPLYRQLIRQIKTQIDSGQLPAGTRLPASRELAEQINISRISVVNAYAELRAEGYLSAHAGRGTFVAKEGANTPLRQTTPHHNQAPDSEALADYSLRDMMRLARKNGMINFSHGSPPPDFYPINHLKDAINHVLERDGVNALGYEAPEGYAPLRATVRDYVSGLGIRCSAENVLITGGAQQAIDLVIQSIMNEGDTLVTANPTYLGVVDIARARKVNIYAIPHDEEGMRLDHLENYLLENKPRLIYVMPSFHNPTGVVMPLHRRRQLLNLANEYGVPILEDAVYHELRFEGENVPLLKELDDRGVVLHVSAFTKIMLPGLRIGYVIANSHHLDRLSRVKFAADISTSGLNQRAMHLMIQRGILANQLERNNRELHKRRDAAIEAAQRHFPEGTTWNHPQGGLYLWVRFPSTGPTSAEMFINSVQKGVSFAIGNIFYTNNCGNYHIRLNYGLQRPDMINEGFRRIGQAWEELGGEYHHMDKSPVL